jgi:hypothetical protein
MPVEQMEGNLEWNLKLTKCLMLSLHVILSTKKIR